MTKRITKCVNCDYQALTYLDKCLKCGGKLEIIASEIKISVEALKGKTVGEIIELSKQAQDLPMGFKLTYKKPKPKIQTAEELLEEIINDK